MYLLNSITGSHCLPHVGNGAILPFSTLAMDRMALCMPNDNELSIGDLLFGRLTQHLSLQRTQMGHASPP